MIKLTDIPLFGHKSILPFSILSRYLLNINMGMQYYMNIAIISGSITFNIWFNFFFNFPHLVLILRYIKDILKQLEEFFI